MKKRYIKIAVVILLISINFSCEKVIEMDIKNTQIRIVANSIITPDSTISVHLTRSRHILDNANIEVLKNATIKLYEDNVFIGQLNYSGGGIYNIDYKPKENGEYKIEVEHDSYDNVVATTKIPIKIPIVQVSGSTIINEYGNDSYSIGVTINDPNDEENYYLLRCRYKNQHKVYDPDLIIYDTVYVSADTVVIDTIYGGQTIVEKNEYIYLGADEVSLAESYPEGGLLLSDELFDGSNYEFRGSFNRWSFESYDYGEDGNTSNDTVKVYIELYSINSDLYKYAQSYNKHFDSQGDPFAQPVNVYTNIENGIGIFCGASKPSLDSLTYIVKPYVYY